MPSTLEKVQIPAYGEKHPLADLGQIVAKNATTLQINVFDTSLSATIAKVLRPRLEPSSIYHDALSRFWSTLI